MNKKTDKRTDALCCGCARLLHMHAPVNIKPDVRTSRHINSHMHHTRMHAQKQIHTHTDACSDKQMQIILACMLRDGKKGTDGVHTRISPHPAST